jgi:glyoxylase-like metal-dependent hydrolase (beta-lactamase superfamily II)
VKTELCRTRPGGFEIRPASAEAAVPIEDGIYLSPGLSNSYLVVTSEGRVVINAGMTFEAPVHKRNYDAVDTGPVRAVILTQGHVDHVGGVSLFMEEGTQLIAQSNNASCQDDDARIARFRVMRSIVFFREAVTKGMAQLRKQPKAPRTPAAAARPVPTLTFDDRHEFTLGSQRFELLSTPGGETIDSLCVWLPERGVAFVGNLFSALFPHIPNLVTMRGDRYRFTLPYIESLDRVLALEPEVLLTGHFEPVRGKAVIRSELERLRAAALYVHDETVKGMNEGKDVHTLMREITLPDDIEVGQGYGKVAWNVRAIWESYAGWFHYRSTTELYGEPPGSAHPEIVALAGGPDAVAARAAALAEATPLQAIALAEMALASDPSHAASHQVMVAAHQALLREVGGDDPEHRANFWEVGWLRHQIARSKSALEAE